MIKLPIAAIVSEDFQLAARNLAGIAFPNFKQNRDAAKFYRTVREALASHDKTRTAILEAHGTKTTDGGFKIMPDKIAVVRAELEKLGAEEVEFDISPVVLPPNALLCGRDQVELSVFLSDADVQTPLPTSAPANSPDKTVASQESVAGAASTPSH